MTMRDVSIFEKGPKGVSQPMISTIELDGATVMVAS